MILNQASPYALRCSSSARTRSSTSRSGRYARSKTCREAARRRQAPCLVDHRPMPRVICRAKAPARQRRRRTPCESRKVDSRACSYVPRLTSSCRGAAPDAAAAASKQAGAKLKKQQPQNPDTDEEGAAPGSSGLGLGRFARKVARV